MWDTIVSPDEIKNGTYSDCAVRETWLAVIKNDRVSAIIGAQHYGIAKNSVYFAFPPKVGDNVGYCFNGVDYGTCEVIDVLDHNMISKVDFIKIAIAKLSQSN